jgi:hypothetical protein
MSIDCARVGKQKKIKDLEECIQPIFLSRAPKLCGEAKPLMMIDETVKMFL